MDADTSARRFTGHPRPCRPSVSRRESNVGAQRIRREEEEEGRQIFPLDILIEILLRLTVRSIVRFRCVCKLWRSITYDPHFMDTFNERARTTRPPAILLSPYSTVQSLGLATVDDPSAPEIFFLRPGTIDLRARSISWGDGLAVTITCDRSVLVMNPATSECLTLPEPPPKKPIVEAYLGFHPVTKEYKVVAYFGDLHWQVCTVGTSSWRPICQNPAERHYCKGVSMNGAIYWNQSSGDQPMLLSFDLRDERFSRIEGPNLPDIYHRRVFWIGYRLAVLQGSICLTAFPGDLSHNLGRHVYPQMDIWMLNHGVSTNHHHKWTLKYSLNFPWMDEEPKPLFIHNDKILVQSAAGSSSKWSLRYHYLKSNSRSDQEGGNDEQDVNVGNIKIPYMCSPHVESLHALPKVPCST